MFKDMLRDFAEDRAIERILKIKEGYGRQEIKNQKTIIFNRVYATFTKTFYHEVGIAKVLQLQGHNVCFLLCDGCMKKCTPVFTVKEGSEKICDRCQSFGEAMLKASGIHYRKYTDIIQENRGSLPLLKSDIQCVKDSMSRYFKGITEYKDYEYDEVASKRYLNAMMSKRVGEIIYKEMKPDVIFSTHYGYSEWNPFHEYMKEKGVRSVVWDYIYGDNNMVLDMEKLGNIFKKINKNNLKAWELEQLVEYIRKRKTATADNKTYGINTSKKIKRPKYENVYAMFPNLPWDTSLINADRLYKGVYDWIDDTIEFFKKHQENFLFIKIHPAEVVDGSYETVGDYINKKHILTPNIKIIDVEDGIGSYNLYEIIDAGIVYNGTAGIEMSMEATPAIVVGNIYYAKQGFTYDPKTKKEYYKLLESKPRHITQKQIEKAHLFGSFYFCDSRLLLTYVKDTRLGPAFDIDDFSELEFEPNMERIMKYILEGEIYQEKGKSRYSSSG